MGLILVTHVQAELSAQIQVVAKSHEPPSRTGLCLTMTLLRTGPFLEDSGIDRRSMAYAETLTESNPLLAEISHLLPGNNPHWAVEGGEVLHDVVHADNWRQLPAVHRRILHLPLALAFPGLL